jgi:hypothetical protein
MVVPPPLWRPARICVRALQVVRAQQKSNYPPIYQSELGGPCCCCCCRNCFLHRALLRAAPPFSSGRGSWDGTATSADDLLHLTCCCRLLPQPLAQAPRSPAS